MIGPVWRMTIIETLQPNNMKENSQFAYYSLAGIFSIAFYFLYHLYFTDSLLLRIKTCLLHSKSGDEDVDDDGEEHQHSCHIVYHVQLPLIGHIIEVFACWEGNIVWK